MMRNRLVSTACGLAAAWMAAAASAQSLYSQNFDVDDTANWTVNLDGATDGAANFFFDYSTIGIPAAPNSGGTTRGMKLQANQTTAAFGGMSVSPNTQSFTGDYVLKFDLYSSYIGWDNEAAPGAGVGLNGDGATADGATMLSTFGIMTAGNVANRPGISDSVFFAATADGGSGADYRVYSAERPVSYQLPVSTPTLPNGSPNPDYCACDANATYVAGSRNNTATLYSSNFGGATVPTAMTTEFPETQFGTTQPGSLGFEWHAVEIKKQGTLVSWSVDGVELITVETATFEDPVGGSNILFGHADINGGISADPYALEVQLTLIDNVRVEALTGGTIDADFDNVNGVEGGDVLIWQQNLGISDGSATNADGDANGDGNVTDADLDAWVGAFGTPATASIGVVPEPSAAVLAGLALLCVSRSRRRVAIAD